MDDTLNIVTCPFCGAKNLDDLDFCLACGRRMDAQNLDENPQAPIDPPKERMGRGLIVAIVVIVLLVGLLGFLVYDDITLRSKLLDAEDSAEANKEKLTALESTSTQVNANNEQQISDLTEAVAERDAAIAQRDALIEEQNLIIKTDSPMARFYEQIIQVAENRKTGYGSETFNVNDGVVVLKKGDTESVTMTANWPEGGSVTINTDTSAATVKMDYTTWRTDTTLTVTGVEPGVTVATFTNTVNSDSFQLLVIVTE